MYDFDPDSGNTTKNRWPSSEFLILNSLYFAALCTDSSLFPQFHLGHINFMPEAESLQVTCRLEQQLDLVVGALPLVPGR